MANYSQNARLNEHRHTWNTGIAESFEERAAKKIKRVTHEKIAAQIEEFLAAGNEITVLPEPVYLPSQAAAVPMTRLTH